MPLIAYNKEQLFFNPDILDEDEKAKFTIQEVSTATFEILQKLPSKAFELGTNIHNLVERLICD